MLLRFDPADLSSPERPIGIGRAGFGMPPRAPESDALVRLYLADDLAAAMSLLPLGGVGTRAQYLLLHACLEAEEFTGRSSEILQADEWLQVEAVRSEAALPLERMAEIARGAIAAAAAVLGFRESIPVMVTLLASDALPPEPVQDTGYAVLKEPYAKLCVPNALAQTEEALTLAVGQLMAPVAGHVCTEGRAWPWLLDGTRALLGADARPDLRVRFCSGQLPWLGPDALARAYDGAMKTGGRGLVAARAQSLIVAHEMLKMRGVPGYAECLSYHVGEDILERVQRGLVHLTWGSLTEPAIRSVYETTPERLFEQALAVCCR